VTSSGARAPAKTGTYQLSGSRGVGYAVEDLDRAYFSRLIESPELPMSARSCELVKQGRSAELVRLPLGLECGTVPVAYKRIRRPGWRRAASDLLRTHRALRAWQIGHELLRRGISTARPLAVIIPRRLRDTDAFLATEWLEGAENLNFFAMRIRRLEARNRFRPLKGAAERVGELLGQLHAGSITHRDLKASNLLVCEEVSGFRAFVIDLDGASIKWWLSSELRLRNLARLDVSLDPHECIGKTSRLRFLLKYLAASGRSAESWKTLWRGVARHSNHIRQRRHKSGATAFNPKQHNLAEAA